MYRKYLLTLWAALLAVSLTSASSVSAGEKPKKIAWHSDYSKTMGIAEQEGRMMLVLFHHPCNNRVTTKLESTVLKKPYISKKLSRFVCVKLSTNTTISAECNKKILLLNHPAFKGMCCKPGIAILDFASRNADYYGCVVTAFPISRRKTISSDQMAALLDLPPGMPEERSKIYASKLCDLKNAAASQKVSKLIWLDDYAEATCQAKKQKRMMLILFEQNDSTLLNRFKSETLTDPTVRRLLENFVLVRLPVGGKVPVDAGDAVLLHHPTFAGMQRRPGVAIIDYANRKAPFHGCVVSTFPLTERFFYNPAKMRIILNLPPGTLTQRTLIYAVRIHPECPKSTNGEINNDLVKEANSHSIHQASIRLQGHHQWDQRFHRINSQLPSGLTACEVCAESWPGEDLLEAAIECVRSWRRSQGHWSAVRASHPCYGYDMKRGRNGIWYATGIFGKRSR